MKHWELFVGETMWFPDIVEGVMMISAERRVFIDQPLRTILTEAKRYLKEYCEYVSLERSTNDDEWFPVSAARLVIRQGNHVKLFYKAGKWELELIQSFKPVKHTMFESYKEAAERFIDWSVSEAERIQ